MTPIHQRPKDRALEDRAFLWVPKVHPGVVVHRFDDLFPIDAWMDRNRSLAGLLEIKGRAEEELRSRIDWILNIRKYDVLFDAEVLFGCPAEVWFAFKDALTYIRLCNINPKNNGIFTRTKDAEARNQPSDYEPVIYIPRSSLTVVCEGKDWTEGPGLFPE